MISLLLFLKSLLKKNTYKSILTKRNNTIKQVKKKFQKRIAQHKTSAGYTKAIGLAMGIVVSKKVFDAAKYKTSLNVRMEGNKVAIRFMKLGVQGINIYFRKKSGDAWNLLSRATRSPFEFTSTVKNSNQPELWEFMAFGVINDKEIGLASDITDLIIGSKIG